METKPWTETMAERARAGDRSAFASSYAHFASMVHGLLVASVPRAAVDDLVQEVFLVAWREREQLREPARFGGWLAGIARNLAQRHHRSSPRAPEPLPADLPERVEPDASGRTPGLDGETAWAALAELPATYRETLSLRLVEGLTGPEIAERLGMTHGSVRVNLTRGMALLRARLRRGDTK